MFLEMGIPGGMTMLAILWLLWRESRRLLLLPVEVALVVAFVGGMGGEYFYGGMPLLTLVMVIAPIGTAFAEACWEQRKTYGVSRQPIRQIQPEMQTTPWRPTQ
jgi:hypothetical protein